MSSIEDALRKGFQSSPKYIPVWYRYDEDGSKYNDKCLTDNTFYYFFPSEMEIIRQHVHEFTDVVSSPFSLVDMGSGNSEKTRIIIDKILQRTDTLSYIPIDISKDFLLKDSAALCNHYNGKVKAEPIAGDYDVGIEKLSDVNGRKLIVWLGGGFQNQSYEDQCKRLRNLSNIMTEEDRLIVALDITQDASAVENSYLDPTGVSKPLYLNAIWRLNREMGSNIDTDLFDLRAKFVLDQSPNHTSYLTSCAISKQKQHYEIPGLKISVTFQEGEELRLFEGEGVSCKYTSEQLHDLASNGNMTLSNRWTDDQEHVSLCCLKKR